LKSIEEILAENISTLRKAAGFRSREAFAEAAELAWPTYRDIESGKSWPERKNLAAIASTLGVPESRLFADPDLIPTPTNKQILEAINEALMERDMLRDLQRQGLLPQRGSREWREMLMGGLTNRHIVETAEEQVERESLLRAADEAIEEEEEKQKGSKRR
jgi:transcriptional regulator with XRE-family HTH domain